MHSSFETSITTTITQHSLNPTSYRQHSFHHLYLTLADISSTIYTATCSHDIFLTLVRQAYPLAFANPRSLARSSSPCRPLPFFSPLRRWVTPPLHSLSSPSEQDIRGLIHCTSSISSSRPGTTRNPPSPFHFQAQLQSTLLLSTKRCLATSCISGHIYLCSLCIIHFLSLHILLQLNSLMAAIVILMMMLLLFLSHCVHLLITESTNHSLTFLQRSAGP